LAAAGDLARGFREIAWRVRDRVAATMERESQAAQVYDVVVIGAGPLGLAFAAFLLDQRPGTRIAVLDRRDAAGYKIGESTLGGSVRGFKSLGLNNAVLRRLFEGKFGLSLWWTGETSDLAPHLDIGHFDETFQVERRALETALCSAVARRGVEILRGTRVIMGQSSLGADGNELVCQDAGGREVRFRARIVCDASGPAAVIPRALGLYHKRIDTFQTNAYFGYFRKKALPELAHWNTHVTKHVAFPQGWVWFIDLQSWERTPDAQLQAMVDFLVDHPDGPDEDYPTRNELIERFDCTVDEITSIGIVPRDDLDDSKGVPVEQRFRHYVDKYPGLKWIMDHFEPVEGHYEGHRDFSAFQKMAHDCERVSGDGWVAIGDAAMFVNPLWSPGMSFGMGTAYLAALDSVHALNRSDTTAASFASYERYARDLYTQLMRENDMFYLGFAHPDLFDRTWMLKLAQATSGTRGPRESYSASDPYLTNLLEPRYRRLVETVVALMREQEAAGADPADTAARVRALVDPYIAAIAARPGHREAGFDRFFAHHDADFRHIGDKPDRKVAYPTWCCPNDSVVVGEDTSRCFVCGGPRPADPTPGHAYT
jgi:flavin-dependent dehydrogenase